MDGTANALTATKSNKWVKGQSGNPKGRKPGVVSKTMLLRKQFIDTRGSDVLECLLGAAYSDPATARWLAARFFGEGRWSPAVRSMSIETVEECQSAIKETTDAFIGGSITEDEMTAIHEALFNRFAHLDHAEKAPKPKGKRR